MNAHRHLMIDIASTRLTPDERHLLKNYQIGGICLFKRNVIDRYQLAEFTHELRELAGSQLLIAIDQEGGSVVRIMDTPHSPGTMALGAANQPDLTRKVAAATGRGLNAVGINIDFAPSVDVNNNPDNPVIGERAFGSDPQHVATHAVAFIQGLQTAGVAATAKHFPGHGDTSVDSHLALPKLTVSKERLDTVELTPFRAAIAANVACIMSYHGVIEAYDPKNPATLSKTIMTDLLRNQLEFSGVSFTDALEMQAIAALYSPAESVLRALMAGADMALYDVHTGDVKTHVTILEALDKAFAVGQLNPEALARSATRLQELSLRYPARYQPDAAWQADDTDIIATAAQQAIVIQGAFTPLDKHKPVTIVTASNVTGGAASETMQTPAQAFIKALTEAGFTLNTIFYDKETLPDTTEQLRARVGKSEQLLFVSASRTRMSAQEAQLGTALAAQAQTYAHVALWNPYHAADLPDPAIITFGFRDASIQALISSLQTARSYGHLPIALRHGMNA